MLREQQQRWVIPWFHLAHLCHLHIPLGRQGGGGLEADACCWLALIVFISSFFPLIVVLLPWVSKLSGEIVLIVSFYGVKYFWNCCAVDPKSAQVSLYFFTSLFFFTSFLLLIDRMPFAFLLSSVFLPAWLDALCSLMRLLSASIKNRLSALLVELHALSRLTQDRPFAVSVFCPKRQSHYLVTVYNRDCDTYMMVDILLMVNIINLTNTVNGIQFTHLPMDKVPREQMLNFVCCGVWTNFINFLKWCLTNSSFNYLGPLVNLAKCYILRFVFLHIKKLCLFL